AGSPQFTHVAYHDFRVVQDNLKGGNRTTKDRIVPFCMFTDPELARVGRNESDEIVGFTAFGVEASELMAAVQTAMVGRLPYTVLRDAIFAHPTMSEGLVFLLQQVEKRKSS